jgi:arylsulfatase A-like enzyme
VGQVVAAVEDKGLRERTLFIFTADNGGYAPGRVTDNGPLRAGKGTLYEGGVRAAAFAAWDGRIRPGLRIKTPLHAVDWYPTLLNLAGAPTTQKAPLDGKDLWPCLTGGAASPHEEILLNAAPGGGAIRVGDWKLVLGANTAVDEPAKEAKKKKAGGDGAELYNLAEDPGEKDNRAARNPDKVKELRARYDRLAAQALPARHSGPAPGKKAKDGGGP